MLRKRAKVVGVCRRLHSTGRHGGKAGKIESMQQRVMALLFIERLDTMENELTEVKRMNNIDSNTEGAVRRFLALISDRYDVAGAILYGSRARGAYHKESDADVAVLLKGEHRRFDALMDMSRIAFDVMLETGILVSPLPLRLDDWEDPENYSNPELLRNIDREGIRV
jgi:predicted nucleotidyltransferase